MKQIILIDTEVTEDAIQINKKDLIPLYMDKEAICSSGHKIMAELRTVGPLASNAIWLSQRYDWHIGKDREGAIVLIPIEKKV